MRDAFFAAYDEDECEYIPLMSPKIDERLKNGPEMVSANFVIPYPPGFPIMVPGQVIASDTIDFMRKLDVKEIHGYNNDARPQADQAVGDRQRVAGKACRACAGGTDQEQGICQERLIVNAVVHSLVAGQLRKQLSIDPRLPLALRRH